MAVKGCLKLSGVFVCHMLRTRPKGGIMSVRLGVTFALAAVALLAATPDAAVAQKKRTRDVILQEEIEKSGQLERDLIGTIRNLRPHFLEAPRGNRSMGNSVTFPLVVYVDGIKQPGVDALQSIMAKDVREVRYLEPSLSMNRYGATANGGAIEVKTLTSKNRG
jgi:hypothetical protein